MKNIYKAIAAFQDEVPVIHEDTKGYNYTYANLNKIFDTIKPLLKKHGLGFTQMLNGDSLNTIIFHIESAEVLESSIGIDTSVNLAGMNKYQTLGSAITYFRRYSLACMLGLITDKDIDSKGDQVKPVVAKKAPTKKTLTIEDFNKCLESTNVKQIQTVLNKFELKDEQKTLLSELVIKLNEQKQKDADNLN
jgi:hypothetical protein